MSLLSYVELVKLVEDGVINAPLENINAASIDITLDNIIRVERGHLGTVDLYKKENILTHELNISLSSHSINPDEFILASSVEVFNLPNDIAAEYSLKSSMARNGLDHLNAGWCDPGWKNSRLTLELKNMSRSYVLKIKAGMKIGQVKFFRVTPVPDEKLYSKTGQYNNQQKVTESKGIR